MYDRPRVIPTLLIDEGGLYKTQKFAKPDYLGDPVNAIKIFNEKLVDELCVLDFRASKKKHAPDIDLLKKMATEAFMPLSYGGGIKTLDEIKKIFSIGFEKVILNSSLVNRKEVFMEAVSIYGSQSIVASIDYKKSFREKRCYVLNGTEKVNYAPEELAVYAERLGAGEILLYSMDRDGMNCGYDVETIKKVVQSVNIPVIACGGAGSLEHMRQVLDDAGAHAVAAGNFFVYYGKRNAVLIHFPSEMELINANIFKERG